jgi:hypothetical protein
MVPVRSFGVVGAEARMIRRLLLAAAVVCLLTGGYVALAHPWSSAAGARTPTRASRDYYAAVARKDAPRAFDGLCQAQRAVGLESYSASLKASVAVRSWRVAHERHLPAGSTPRDGYAVDGVLSLADGSAVPLSLLLVRETGRLLVCGSSLGGVLPGPAGTPVDGGARV